ncbi:hypothetical protein SAMN02799624_05453 [Paenibacillus sp. UNC496MF]|uniref:alpha/beta fold hydrolase n=1 Tax=Paenibacillus sp. UNC496MF TaxID=1502753 RepID=UPI0008F21148|nr:alpha/beta fold hydrolase [Paenibacillus sp. UNC496MF]SFJ68013.1 hypothetical protein SAMN02799624_05453 [Paenibacillus sp. UNC496MF]
MIQERKLELAGVPCLELSPGEAPAGQVLLYHGWGSTMASYRFFASVVAGWGFRVTVPELPLHGERGSLDYGGAETLRAHFWPIVRQGVGEAGALADELARRSDAPVAVVGHSTGGFIAAGAFAAQPRLRSAAVINGSCAWVRFEEHYRARLGIGPMAAEDRARLERDDPFPRLRLQPERPLLLLHCEGDTTVPVDSQRYFADALRGDGELPEQVRLLEFPRADHVITLGMLEQLHDFWTRPGSAD